MPLGFQERDKKDVQALIDSLKQRYTGQGLWSLFLMCAFPLHAWTIIMSFRDLSWLIDGTNAWDAVGVLAYGLIFTFVECISLFLVMGLLGFLISLKWEPERRIVLLTVLVIILSLWAMFSQLFFLMNMAIPSQWVGFLINTGHPLRVWSAGILVTVGLSFLVPALVVIRSTPAFRFVRGLIERLSVLTVLYLFFDVVGLIIVLIRNI